MKTRFVIAMSLIITLACGCLDDHEYKRLASESCVVTLCRNHVKDGMIWAEIVEIWRDESKGVFTNKVADTIETDVPTKSQMECGEGSVMFYGSSKGSLRNYRTLYVHDGSVSGDVTVEKFKSMVRDSRYSGKDIEIPCTFQGVGGANRAGQDSDR